MLRIHGYGLTGDGKHAHLKNKEKKFIKGISYDYSSSEIRDLSFVRRWYTALE